MLISAILEVIGIGMIPVFVSIIATPDTILNIEWLLPMWEKFGIETSGDLLVYGAIFLIGVFSLKNIYLLFYGYIKARFIWLRFASIGSNLFKYYMYAPYDFHLRRNTSELLRNVTQETSMLANHVISPLLMIIMDVVLITSIFAMLIWMEPINTLIVFVILGGGGALFLRIIRKKMRFYGKTALNDRAKMIRSVNDGLGGFKDARVLNREQWFHKKFSNNIKSYGKSQTFNHVVSMANKPVIETIAITGLLLIALLLYWQGRNVESVIPVMTLFGAATYRLMPALQGLIKSITSLKYHIYSVDPLYDDTLELKRNVAVGDKEVTTKLIFSNKILFEETSFTYPGSENEAVKNLSVSISKGEAIGFVGPSGAGKTTLMDMLLGLLEPQKGRITVDGINIYSNVSEWKENIGYIPQFIFLSDDTIRRNIAFGLSDDEIEEGKLQNAIKAAQLNEFLENLPKGVNTIIGERGTRLSGGQRQRIGIARALYNNPQVLIMDEATSALDNITEKFVIQAVEQLKRKRTIIMIAHRLTTVRNCDRLYYMDKAQIKDYGTFHELIAKNSEFKKMALMTE